MNKIDEYKKNLATAEDAVDFCTLVPEEVFRYYPISLPVSILLKDENCDDNEKERIDRLAKERTEQMINGFDLRTNGYFNAKFSVDSKLEESKLYDGESEWRWRYVAGQGIYGLQRT